MKNNTNVFLRLLLFSVTVFTVTGCYEEHLFVPEFDGPQDYWQQSNIKSTVKLDATGKLEKVNLIFSESVLTDLPEHVQELQIPVQHNLTEIPVDHISLKWDPVIDQEEGIFTTPHFEAGFHLIPLGERKAMVVNDPLAENLPELDLMPEGFVPSKGSFHMGGKRWVNPLAEELHQQEETHTFMVNTYDGDFISYVPAFTLDYIREAGNQIFEIAGPEGLRELEVYPFYYSLSFDEVKKEYIVSLYF